MIIPKIDTLNFVRSHPRMFLPDGAETGLYLAQLVAEMATLRGATAPTVDQRDGWWRISSDVDWLHDQQLDVRPNVFLDMIPCPAAGLFAFYPEILLTAFATHVVSASKDQVMSVMSIPHDRFLEDVTRNWLSCGVGRTVGFTLAAG